MEQDRQIEALNELLKGEYMARNIYDKTKNIQGDEQVKTMLAKFQKDHDRHIQLLEKRIRELGGEPEAGLGWPVPWPTYRLCISRCLDRSAAEAAL